MASRPASGITLPPRRPSSSALVPPPVEHCTPAGGSKYVLMYCSEILWTHSCMSACLTLHRIPLTILCSDLAHPTDLYSRHWQHALAFSLHAIPFMCAIFLQSQPLCFRGGHGLSFTCQHKTIRYRAPDAKTARAAKLARAKKLAQEREQKKTRTNANIPYALPFCNAHPPHVFLV